MMQKNPNRIKMLLLIFIAVPFIYLVHWYDELRLSNQVQQHKGLMLSFDKKQHNVAVLNNTLSSKQPAQYSITKLGTAHSDQISSERIFGDILNRYHAEQ